MPKIYHKQYPTFSVLNKSTLVQLAKHTNVYVM